MKNWLLVLAMLFLIASCGAPAPTATRLPASTPPPISMSDAVATLAPDRPTIPRPSVVPLKMVTPLNPDAPGGYLVEDRFYSRLLGEQMPILLYLPPGYFESTRRYPVLYMLSGFSGDYREWATYGLGDVIDALIRGGKIPPMMIAMPEGAKSWWMNHAPPQPAMASVGATMWCKRSLVSSTPIIAPCRAAQVGRWADYRRAGRAR